MQILEKNQICNALITLHMQKNLSKAIDVIRKQQLGTIVVVMK